MGPRQDLHTLNQERADVFHRVQQWNCRRHKALIIKAVTSSFDRVVWRLDCTAIIQERRGMLVNANKGPWHRRRIMTRKRMALIVGIMLLLPSLAFAAKVEYSTSGTITGASFITFSGV